jgi:hypothetical protein
MHAAAGLPVLEPMSRRPVSGGGGGQYQGMGRYAFSKSRQLRWLSGAARD